MRGWNHRHRSRGLGPWRQVISRDGAFPLSEAGQDQVVEVVELAGGRNLGMRLAEMGIAPGSSLRVFTNIGGPVIVEVKGSKLCLGRGMATKILVKA